MYVSLDRSFLMDSFLEQLPERQQRYHDLVSEPEPEDNPYEAKYRGRDLLIEWIAEVDGLVRAEYQKYGQLEDKEKGENVFAVISEQTQDEMRLAKANLLRLLGKNYFHCEEVQSGVEQLEKSLELYYSAKKRDTVIYEIQDMLNSLGQIWAERQDGEKALNYLRRAQLLYQNTEKLKKTREVENEYILTIFQIAQAYGNVGQPKLSAHFCAETLSRQLDANINCDESVEQLQFDIKSWLRNLAGLSDFFLNRGMFWSSEYCLVGAAEAAKLVQEQQLFQTLQQVSTRLEEFPVPHEFDELVHEIYKDLGNHYKLRLQYSRMYKKLGDRVDEEWQGLQPNEKKLDKELLTGLPFQVNSKIYDQIDWTDQFPEYVGVEKEEFIDKILSEEEVVEQTSAKDLKLANERLSGYLRLSENTSVRPAVHFRPLHALIEKKMKQLNGNFFSGNWSRSFVARDAKQAREIFRLSLTYTEKSLEFFVLDGHTTTHCHLQLQKNVLYREFQIGFEDNEKNLIALYSRRLSFLEPILEVLNPKVYLEFFRTFTYETSEILRELTQIKKSKELKERCLRHYNKFLDSFRPPYSETEEVQVPEDYVPYFITSLLNLAQLHMKLNENHSENITKSLRVYQRLLRYVAKNQDSVEKAGMQQEVDLAKQMVELLPLKLAKQC